MPMKQIAKTYRTSKHPSRRREFGPVTPAGTDIASPKQLELEDKIAKKRQEILGLESELAAEKERHSEETAKKKMKFNQLLDLRGDSIPDQLGFLVDDMDKIWLPMLSLYKEVQRSISVLMDERDAIDFHEFTDEELDALEWLGRTIAEDRRSVVYPIYTSVPTLEEIRDKLGNMVMKAKKE
ncbi:chromatin assembly factor 1 subunit a [Diplodia corticola]|uniref:Chromatin assembly factor 1 subunit a n=1 Tax=Diplodia corticola TaxID=236234 RepID=A0A1J9S180_9PEZI|nr:chromatin assembly factor 1 subunit a [Diplodia corticola]OJD33780.1 chromatin assembly factor 1 subunit a [Diplodia corticola]